MFSGHVRHVSGTRIFARSAGDGRQILAYAMSMSADADVAMILPLPVPPSPPEDAVRFIDLSEYPMLFEDLSEAFPQERAARLHEDTLSLSLPPTLKVHDVGDFEASFVPRLADFSRLDQRFRLPEQVWEQLPGYSSFGFAVFKLRNVVAEHGDTKPFHPMAFEFPVRDPSRLFFPTVHVHDGAVRPRAFFEHLLYFQGNMTGFDTASVPVRDVVDVKRAAGVVDADAPLHRWLRYGSDDNADTYV